MLEPYWTEQRIVEAVSAFYHREGRWPSQKDFVRTHGLPARTIVNRRMRTWQEPVRMAQTALREREGVTA
ncbi:MAG TPA: hypothetical protein VI542_27785 [Candidatus Tectomicrobia bacterium]